MLRFDIRNSLFAMMKACRSDQKGTGALESRAPVASGLIVDSRIRRGLPRAITFAANYDTLTSFYFTFLMIL